MAEFIDRVAVTGASGNLGRKIVASLASAAWCGSVTALQLEERQAHAASGGSKVTYVTADLSDPTDRRWIDAIDGVEAIVHLAARNPFPDATWDEAMVSLGMTAALLFQAIRTGVRRFVFTSSNHVMGGYKDIPGLGPGDLTTAQPPLPGTRAWQPDGSYQISLPYATAKLMGEVACRQAAHAAEGRLTTACLRIGWCQPGDNLAQTLSAAGTPTAAAVATNPDEARDLAWFQDMWLSNRDLAGIVERALLADAAAWPSPAIVVNAMSGNAGMPWDLELTRRCLAYSPQDDVRRALADLRT